MTTVACPRAGQALVEALLGLSVLGMLLLLVPLLGRLQDVALQGSVASRYAAFSAAQGMSEGELERQARARFFDPVVHRWVGLEGRAMLGADDTSVVLEPGFAFDPHAQIGGLHADTATLRQELQFADRGMLVGRTRASPRLATSAASPGAGPASLRRWAAMELVLDRQVALIADGAAAPDDASVQAAVARSEHGWLGAARSSTRAAARLDGSLRRLDAAWGRARPELDWLGAWRGALPEDRLTPMPGRAR